MVSGELVTLINGELNWRERELAILKRQLQRDTEDSVKFGCSYRSFIAITYAHYEGFSKNLVAQAYLDIKNNTKPHDCSKSIVLSIVAPILRKRLKNFQIQTS
jgi:hypothetical protein